MAGAAAALLRALALLPGMRSARGRFQYARFTRPA
jgi:hypothetical protein